MTDEEKIGTPEDDSNIDQINNFVTNSTETESKVEEQPAVAEKSKVEQEAKPVEKLKAKEKIESEKKAENKNPHNVKHAQAKHIIHAKKPEAEKEEKHEKAEHKHVKVAKSEPKKVMKESPKAKKIIVIKNPVKEEKMKEKDHKEHKEHKKPLKLGKNTLMWIGIGVLAVILIIALILILSPGKNTPKPITNTTSNSIAATVNGEPIYLQDVVNEYNNLNSAQQPSALQPVYSVESILNKSIDDLLLYQEAKNNGITVKAEEVQAEIDAIKIQYKLTDTALETALAQQKMTIESWKLALEKSMSIEKFLNATVLKNITVTDAQIESYYNLNLDKFKVPEKVTVQHILILVTSNVTNETAKAKIEQVQKELNDTNFCDLVTKYSEDPGSLGTCGKYTFARGEMVPEFENPSFDMNVGETTIVKTIYGYHLIKKLESIPAGTMNLSDASKEINVTVHDQIAQKRFDALLEELRAKASIINYMTKVDSNETVIPQVKSLDDFAKCITEKGAVFYGASWCPHCQDQKTLFGDSLQYVKYVECADANNPQVQTKECTAAGISGYPTWIINNQSYPGEQTLDGLAKLTGCTVPQ